MKALAAIFLCLPCSVVMAAQNPEARNTLTVHGTIQPSCAVYLNGDHPLASPIDQLRHNVIAPQIVAEVVLNCNTGEDAVNVTYESMNGGLLMANGTLLDYEKSLSGRREFGLASSGPWTVTQQVGPRSQFLRIRPLVRGAIEGSYSDVIFVSVSFD